VADRRAAPRRLPEHVPTAAGIAHRGDGRAGRGHTSRRSGGQLGNPGRRHDLRRASTAQRWARFVHQIQHDRRPAWRGTGACVRGMTRWAGLGGVTAARAGARAAGGVALLGWVVWSPRLAASGPHRFVWTAACGSPNELRRCSESGLFRPRRSCCGRVRRPHPWMSWPRLGRGALYGAKTHHSMVDLGFR
jgi:hypothetical protein